jgi:uncharacterized protein
MRQVIASGRFWPIGVRVPQAWYADAGKSVWEPTARWGVKVVAGSSEVGRVAALFRYPVKSMRGERIEEARVWWHGIEGDRRYAFVRGNDPSGFSWLTARQVPELLRYAPYFADPENPAVSPVRVRMPDGRDMPVESEALRAEIAARYGAETHLMHVKRGAFDSAGISLISMATLRAIGERVGWEMDPRRFRPNVLVETLEGPYASEDEWVGAEVIIGEGEDATRIRAERKDERCMMINLDPDTARQDPQVLRAVVQTREEYAGIYGSVAAPGTIRVGDVIRLARGEQESPATVP